MAVVTCTKRRVYSRSGSGLGVDPRQQGRLRLLERRRAGFPQVVLVVKLRGCEQAFQAQRSVMGHRMSRRALWARSNTRFVRSVPGSSGGGSAHCFAAIASAKASVSRAMSAWSRSTMRPSRLIAPLP